MKSNDTYLMRSHHLDTIFGYMLNILYANIHKCVITQDDLLSIPINIYVKEKNRLDLDFYVIHR